MTTPQRKIIEKQLATLKKCFEELNGCNWANVQPDQIDELVAFVEVRIETITEKRRDLITTLKTYNTLYKNLMLAWEDESAKDIEKQAYEEMTSRVRPILEKVKPVLAESKANLKLLQERADKREMPDGLQDLDLEEENDDKASFSKAQDDEDPLNPFSPNFELKAEVNQREEEEKPKVKAQQPRRVLQTPCPAPIQFRVTESRKLPELTFGGNILEFRTFMTSFDATFHRQPMTNAEKLSLLLGCLRGQAKTKLDGFGLTDANYEVVRELLERKYGSTDFLKQKLYTELDNIKGNPFSLDEAETAVDRFEKLCRQLEALKEDVNHIQLELKFHKLLPATVLTAVLEKKSLHANWNLKRSRMLVDEFFTRRAQVASILGEASPQPKSVAANASYSPQPEAVKPVRPPQQVSERRDAEAPREPRFCSTTDKHQTDTVPETRFVNAIQSPNDANTLLWTAKVSLVVGKETVSTTALIDPGSQKTLIKSSMIRRLRAKPIEEENYRLATVGNATTQEIRTGIYELQMQLKDGSMYQFNASEMDNLMPELKLPATQVERDELETELQPIGLLIGMPDYFHLVPSGTRLSSGFYQIDSRLGPLIGGTGCLVASVAEETDGLTKMLDKFFSLESLGIDDNPDENAEAVETPDQWPEQPIPTEPPAEIETLIAAAISPLEESKIKWVTRGRLSNGNPKLEGLRNSPEHGSLLARDIKIAQNQLIQETQESFPPSNEEIKSRELIKNDELVLGSRGAVSGLPPKSRRSRERLKRERRRDEEKRGKKSQPALISTRQSRTAQLIIDR